MSSEQILNTNSNVASPNIIKLISLQDEFYKNIKLKGRSPNTIKNYKTDLDCFNQYLQETQNKLDISNFNIPEILEYGKYLETKYSSDNSRRRRIQALRLFFDFLIEKEIFSNNPVKKIPVSPKFLDIPRATGFAHVKTLWLYLLRQSKTAESELERLKAQRNQLIFLLIYTSGLKVSDLATLKKDAFLFGKSSRIMILHPKRDPYSVALHPIVKSVYEGYIELLENLKVRHQIDFDFIFFNANAHKILNGGISSRGIELVFDGWRKALMIDVTPKSLRQSCIFTWLHKDLNEVIIKENLGVAPDYSLKLYIDHKEANIFTDHFIENCYLDFTGAGLS